MSDVLSVDFFASLITGAILAGMPLLFAGLGETVSERAGILNIGLEGMMLFGGYVGFVAALYSSSSALGFLAAIAAGMVVALFMLLFCVRLGLDQIVIGIAILVLFEGLTSLAQRAQFGTTYPRLEAVRPIKIPLLDRTPVLGSSIFSQPLIVYIGLAMCVAVWWVLKYTNMGLNLKAAGEKPQALDAAGVDVIRTRSWAVLVTGGLAGLGGGYMAIVGAGIFVPFMTHGAGFISIVIAMLARGKAAWVVVGAFIFGVAVSISTALQIVGVSVSIDLINMLPFVAVMVALILFARQSVLPAALATPYKRGTL